MTRNTGMEISRHEKILKQDSTALLVIDIQERILKVINEYERVVENSLKLIKGFQILELPVMYTEQYPKGLGPTVSELKEVLGTVALEKTTFSCSGADNLFPTLINSGIKQVAVCGIESHVCVQQTVMDLLANGFQVNVAADAVSSRREFDYKIALDRMNKKGAEITTTESILFELLEKSGTEKFKAISKLVK
jgi:nicotinamidase-related amidase